MILRLTAVGAVVYNFAESAGGPAWFSAEGNPSSFSNRSRKQGWKKGEVWYMFCSKCGAAVNSGSAVCPQCGEPTGVVSGAQGARVEVPNHMVMAILTTLFCCLPGGVIAIIYASQVNNKLATGDIAGAQASAKTAKTWIIINIITPFVSVIVSVIFYLLLAVLFVGAAGASGM